MAALISEFLIFHIKNENFPNNIAEINISPSYLDMQKGPP